MLVKRLDVPRSGRIILLAADPPPEQSTLLGPVRFGGDLSDQPFPQIRVGIRRRFEIQNCLLNVRGESVEVQYLCDAGSCDARRASDLRLVGNLPGFDQVFQPNGQPASLRNTSTPAQMEDMSLLRLRSCKAIDVIAGRTRWSWKVDPSHFPNHRLGYWINLPIAPPHRRRWRKAQVTRIQFPADNATRHWRNCSPVGTARPRRSPRQLNRRSRTRCFDPRPDVSDDAWSRKRRRQFVHRWRIAQGPRRFGSTNRLHAASVSSPEEEHC